MNCKVPCPVVTIGGTNGKGSTCAMLTRILRSGGYRTGTYISPHIWLFNERIAINGVPVDNFEIIAAFKTIENARQNVSLTYFEWATLAAFWIFAQHTLDIWILEVGMGGRLDTTNIIDADISAITSIDLDHQNYLGNTRDMIGLEKLGIARPNKPCIFGDTSLPTTVIDTASSLHIHSLILGQSFGYLIDSSQQWQYWVRTIEGSIKRRFGLPWPSLRGEHQLVNASIALTILEYLNDRLPVSMQATREGLLSTEWPGRFQVLPGQPVTLMDVAHNPHAMKALAKNLDQMAFFPNTWCIWGMLADKDARTCAQILQSHIQYWAVCSLEGERARSGLELETILLSLGISPSAIKVFEHPTMAYQWVSEHTQLSDRIVITGSFSMLTTIQASFS
jgi:dihydrofolate synthase/folylpolyglutamate synthase